MNGERLGSHDGRATPEAISVVIADHRRFAPGSGLRSRLTDFADRWRGADAASTVSTADADADPAGYCLVDVVMHRSGLNAVAAIRQAVADDDDRHPHGFLGFGRLARRSSGARQATY